MSAQEKYERRLWTLVALHFKAGLSIEAAEAAAARYRAERDREVGNGR